MALAALSVADVLYLNLRERAAEIATLKTIGWAGDTSLASSSWRSGGGLLGSIVGAAIGLLVGSLVFSVPSMHSPSRVLPRVLVVS